MMSKEARTNVRLDFRGGGDSFVPIPDPGRRFSARPTEFFPHRNLGGPELS